MYIYVGLCICENRYPQKPKEGAGSYGAEVTGGYELLNMSVGNQCLVLYKKQYIFLTTEPFLKPFILFVKQSLPLYMVTHLVSPIFITF